MTFDLFDDEPAVCDSVQVALPSKSVDPQRLAFVLEPCGLNRWQYRGEILTYDTRAVALVHRPRWSTVEGIDLPEIRGDSHVEVCKAIDARQEIGHA